MISDDQHVPQLLGDHGSSQYTSGMGTVFAAGKGRRREVATVFQVLGNDTRLRIILDLATGEKCVCNIYRRLRLSQNLASHHLGVLREKGIIRARREGKWVYYSLNADVLTNVIETVRGILGAEKGQSVC